jgi:hypothetical protein
VTPTGSAADPQGLGQVGAFGGSAFVILSRLAAAISQLTLVGDLEVRVVDISAGVDAHLPTIAA